MQQLVNSKQVSDAFSVGTSFFDAQNAKITGSHLGTLDYIRNFPIITITATEELVSFDIRKVDMKKIKDKISAYSYAILLALSISVYLLFSFVSIVDGMFVITDFSNYTAMQWILFAVSIVLPTFFGVLINISFRQFGYKVFLEDEVQAMKNRILDLMGNNENEKTLSDS